MNGPMFAIINAKAAAHQEANELAAAATLQHRMEQKAARSRRYNRAKNAAFRRYTCTVATAAALAGVIFASVAIIVIAAVMA